MSSKVKNGGAPNIQPTGPGFSLHDPICSGLTESSFEPILQPNQQATLLRYKYLPKIIKLIIYTGK